MLPKVSHNRIFERTFVNTQEIITVKIPKKRRKKRQRRKSGETTEQRSEQRCKICHSNKKIELFQPKMCHSNDESSCCMAEQVNMSSSSSKRRIAAKSGQSGAKSGEKKRQNYLMGNYCFNTAFQKSSIYPVLIQNYIHSFLKTLCIIFE